ncbi:MAG TPA: hypothetical protein DHW22_08510 [Planctomycetaceae bacterium]|nr:hypothetical protein [Planctomycetaceae bacterium]
MLVLAYPLQKKLFLIGGRIPGEFFLFALDSLLQALQENRLPARWGTFCYCAGNAGLCNS